MRFRGGRATVRFFRTEPDPLRNAITHHERPTPWWRGTAASSRLVVISSSGSLANQRTDTGLGRPNSKDSTGMRSVLSLRNVRKSYRSASRVVNALDGVDLDLLPDHALALVGESGCGKTTLGELTVGLVRPDSGQIMHDSGTDLANCAPVALRSLRPRLQMVFQNPFASFAPHLTLRQSLAPVARRQGIGGEATRQALVDAFAQVGLSADQLERRPAALSGGQLQRAGLARVLLCDAQYIAADEISSALDVAAQDELARLLSRLRAERRFSLLFITHDLSLARQFADHVAVMDAGRIVERGSVDQVLGDPQSAAARRLVAAIPRFRH